MSRGLRGLFLRLLLILGTLAAWEALVRLFSVPAFILPAPSLVVQSAEDPAIGMARNAYTTGNQRLFVGDLDGAVRAYREALEIYPGYVGGYRGLGLAYEQLGDKANALAALRLYVAAVPNARDIALVQKRIIHLQRR